MRTIAHISDLHFGRNNRPVERALLAELHALKPSLVVVSGDLTQRANNREFRHARNFLEEIPFPLLVVPGNHDIPFFDITRRFLIPMHRYRYYITNELSPLYLDEELSVVGLNTTRSFTVQNGKVSPKHIAHMESVFSQVDPSTLRIVVAHHPFVRAPAETRRKIVTGAQKGLMTMDRCNVDLVLVGHFHYGYTVDAKSLYPDLRRQIVIAQAGTAISTRTRREKTNTFNIITVTADEILVTIRGWKEGAFADLTTHTFSRENAS